jgi:hypothetical protein
MQGKFKNILNLENFCHHSVKKISRILHKVLNNEIYAYKICFLR